MERSPFVSGRKETGVLVYGRFFLPQLRRSITTAKHKRAAADAMPCSTDIDKRFSPNAPLRSAANAFESNARDAPWSESPA